MPAETSTRSKLVDDDHSDELLKQFMDGRGGQRGAEPVDPTETLASSSSSADEARRDLLHGTHERLRGLAAGMLRSRFAVLHGRHEPDSVLHRAWPRLLKALESARVGSQDELLRLAAVKIRQVLLELAREHRRGCARLATAGPAETSGGRDDPSRLAMMAEVREFVGRLPEAERAVFELHHHLEVPQAEVARMLGLHPRRVSRLWSSAVERLGRGLGGGWRDA